MTALRSATRSEEAAHYAVQEMPKLSRQPLGDRFRRRPAGRPTRASATIRSSVRLGPPITAVGHRKVANWIVGSATAGQRKQSSSPTPASSPVTPTAVAAPARPLCSATSSAPVLKGRLQPWPAGVRLHREDPTVRTGAVPRRPLQRRFPGPSVLLLALPEQESCGRGLGTTPVLTSSQRGARRFAPVCVAAPASRAFSSRPPPCMVASCSEEMAEP